MTDDPDNQTVHETEVKFALTWDKSTLMGAMFEEATPEQKDRIAKNTIHSLFKLFRRRQVASGYKSSVTVEPIDGEDTLLAMEGGAET